MIKKEKKEKKEPIAVSDVRVVTLHSERVVDGEEETRVTVKCRFSTVDEDGKDVEYYRVPVTDALREEYPERLAQIEEWLAWLWEAVEGDVI